MLEEDQAIYMRFQIESPTSENESLCFLHFIALEDASASERRTRRFPEVDERKSEIRRPSRETNAFLGKTQHYKK